MKNIFRFIGLILLVGGMGCDSRKVPTDDGYVESSTYESDIEVIELGMMCGSSYRVFKDKATGQRIFWYREAMVIIPTVPEKENNE